MRKFAAGGPSLSERMKAREAAYKKATSVESRAAVARAARGLAPRDPSKPAYTMDDYRKEFPSKRPAPPAPPDLSPNLPSPGRGAPTGSRLSNAMAGRSIGLAGNAPAGGTQQMIKNGGMTYSVGGMTPAKKPVGQTRQFGTGPGMRPMPKHLGKAVTDRGRAILGKADGGMTKGSGRDGCAIRGKTRA